MVTLVLERLGLHQCAPEHLDVAGPFNERGNRENAVLRRVNQRLLTGFGGTWFAPPTFPPGWVDDGATDATREQAREALAATMPTSPWVWKDPRLCLTLPWWEPLLDAPPAIVLTYRDPIEVVASLARRNEFEPAHGLALWERYTRDALQAAAGHRVAVISNAAVLADPAGSAADLRDALIALGIALPPTQRAADAPDESPAGAVDPTLRHAAASGGAAAEIALADEQLALVEVLDALPRTTSSLDLPTLPAPSPSMDATLDAQRADRRAAAAQAARPLQRLSRRVRRSRERRSG